jgi:hypothetical protein
VHSVEERFERSSDTVSRRVLDETILVPIRSNVADLDFIYRLNEVGTLIWNAVDGRRGLDSIVDEVCRAFDVTPAEAASDVQDFLHSLTQAGLLRPVAPAEP